ncbi:MAG: Spy/CpxP family protein refolding chaperone [bacterium]
MKLKTIMTVTFLIFATTAFASYRMAPKPHIKKHKRFLPRIEILKAELGLSEEQVTKIKEQRLNSQKQSIELKSRVDIAELELRNMIDENADQNDIKDKIRAIGDLKTQIRIIRVQSRLDFRSSLTTEQQEKLDALKLRAATRKLRGPRGRLHQAPLNPGQKNNELDDQSPELFEKKPKMNEL